MRRLCRGGSGQPEECRSISPVSNPSTSGSRSAGDKNQLRMPGFLNRYAVLALASAVFIVAIFVLFLTLFKQKDLIERESRVNIWSLAQIEVEYLSFVEALDQFAFGEQPVGKDALQDRFVIFSRRLPVLLEEQRSKQPQAVDAPTDSATALIRRGGGGCAGGGGRSCACRGRRALWR